jgi:pyruvate dehydrogenase E2 component (dihydrolipoamide acetyltransferase)
MNTNLRRLIVPGIASLAVVATLAGCGRPAETPPAATPAATPTPAAAPAAPAAPAAESPTPAQH